ncbi:MAG TPA: glycosyltransferase [bacterium]|nr:glycosyltransferase [bacterium]HPR86639.1 glycosyltransferase [bacterium]
MIPLLLALTFLYMAVLLFIAAGLHRLKPAAAASERPFISVLVAARNESAHIAPLLDALSRQDYPGDRYEILLIDDASGDDTVAQVLTWRRAHPAAPLRLLHSTGREQVISPKKHALAQGIAAAQGEILLFTDADCQPLPAWISTMADFFAPEIGMVIGYSPYELPRPRRLGERLLALESLSLAALAAATTGWGRPATCTGRNLGYRKAVWREVDGFTRIAHFISGDDDLFLKQVLERTRWRVAYALHAQAIVPTRLLTSGRAFFRQRLRHASKGFHYGLKMTSLLATAWLFNLLLAAGAISSLGHSPLDLRPWLAWLGKSAVELLLLSRFARAMQRTQTLTVFPLAEFLHVFYVILFGALGPLTRIRWKENAAPVAAAGA